MAIGIINPTGSAADAVERASIAEVPPEVLFLPATYRQQSRARTRDDVASGESAYWGPNRVNDCRKRQYQWHVYRWGARLIRSRALRSVLDVGCGPGWKLAELIAPVCEDITGLDQPSAIDVGRQSDVPIAFHPTDLERPEAPTRAYDLVICADVIEHLIDPRPLLAFLRRAVGSGGILLISTPERDRTRGRNCMECAKPEHVREWTRGEFLALLRAHGFVIERSRLMPHDSTAFAAHRASEHAFRNRTADRSGLGCHAVLCRAR